MIIYGIKNCDTMKKAFTWLEDNGVAYTFHDYKEKGISRHKIEEWMKHKNLDELINMKGTTYKGLTDAEKKSTSNPEKAIELMMANTSMIKRPLVEKGKEIILGFNEDFWDTHL
jgi:arsenate reductase